MTCQHIFDCTGCGESFCEFCLSDCDNAPCLAESFCYDCIKDHDSECPHAQSGQKDEEA